jgi:hypothetical protein
VLPVLPALLGIPRAELARADDNLSHSLIPEDIRRCGANSKFYNEMTATNKP